MDILDEYLLNGGGTTYDEEEISILELVGKTTQKTNEAIEVVNNAVSEVKGKVSHSDMLPAYGIDKNGGVPNFVGTWQGLSRPTLSEEGLRGQVEKNTEDIKNNSEQVLNISSSLAEKASKDICVNVRDLGAIGDGNSHKLKVVFPNKSLAEIKEIYPCAISLDDEIDWCAIQKALDIEFETIEPNERYASDKGAYVVIPRGRYRINRGLQIKHSGASIQGDGDNSIIHAIPYGNFNIISVNEENGYVYNVSISNFLIDGGKTTGNGLNISAPFGDTGDRKYSISDIHIRNCANNFYIRGPFRDSKFDNLYSHYASLHGFYIESSDCCFNSCISARSNKSGFYVLSNGSLQIVNSKSWRNLENGYYLNGCKNISLLASNAQDNQTNGYRLDNCIAINVLGTSDSSNMYGAELNNTRLSNISLTINDRDDEIIKHDGILRINQSIKNIITVLTDLPRYISGDVSNNTININGDNNGYNKVEYTENFTIDTSLGKNIFIELKGNINIANGTALKNGDMVTFIFKQDDVGGRLVNFNFSFLCNWQPNNQANKINVISFIFDSSITRWIQTNSVVGLN